MARRFPSFMRQATRSDARKCLLGIRSISLHQLGRNPQIPEMLSGNRNSSLSKIPKNFGTVWVILTQESLTDAAWLNEINQCWQKIKVNFTQVNPKSSFKGGFKQKLRRNTFWNAWTIYIMPQSTQNDERSNLVSKSVRNFITREEENNQIYLKYPNFH